MLDQLILTSGQRAGLEAAALDYQGHLHLAAEYLTARGVAEDVALKYRMGVAVEPHPGHERLRGKLTLPYLTPAGVVAIKARCIEDHDCKAVGCQRYDAPTGQKVRMYNAGVLVAGGEVAAIVEGELKAICGTERLGVPTVGTPGTTWLDHFSRMFGDFDRVLVIADNDVHYDEEGKAKPNPGRTHAEKVVKAVSGAELVLPPPNVQLDEWVAEEGAEGVLERMGLL